MDMKHVEVNEFANQLGIQLPIDYKRFLIENDGLSFKYYPFEIFYWGESVEFGINHIDSFVDVKINTIELMKFHFSDLDVNSFYINDVESFVSIGIDVNSCNILLGVKEPFNKIYLLDKESVYPSCELKKFLIENSFTDFMTKCLAGS